MKVVLGCTTASGVETAVVRTDGSNPTIIRGRIEGTTTIDDLADCDLVVEAGDLGTKTGEGFYEYD
ncbi:hypothetical protein RBH26_13285 [Natronolimnohabitans sp. A-GB9]|uniref:hypothetical protein n=1 Tax=Natronolimnohabitans sp. A-GB9 TaxID=3069757 RepID=UPI0027B02206|nr:hypothetical protein [Natronolimnohabitans sp. A-GB9]MDQ2051451.1 hypothetical protein [Natronolimnohabitans sp. A-GB9]